MKKSFIPFFRKEEAENRKSGQNAKDEPILPY